MFCFFLLIQLLLILEGKQFRVEKLMLPTGTLCDALLFVWWLGTLFLLSVVYESDVSNMEGSNDLHWQTNHVQHFSSWGRGVVPTFFHLFSFFLE